MSLMCVCTVILTKWSFIEATTADEFKWDMGHGTGGHGHGGSVRTYPLLCSSILKVREGYEPVLSADEVDPCGLECILNSRAAESVQYP